MILVYYLRFEFSILIEMILEKVTDEVKLIWKLWLEWASACPSPHTIHFFPMANEVMKGHVNRSDLNSLDQQKAPVSAYWQSIMGNRLHGAKECARFYYSTSYIRLGMTNTSPTLYCICLVTVLSMLKMLKSAIAVFVFE